jgi:hypothetical protein
MVSVYTADQIISVVTVHAPDRYAAVAVVSDALQHQVLSPSQLAGDTAVVRRLNEHGLTPIRSASGSHQDTSRGSGSGSSYPEPAASRREPGWSRRWRRRTVARCARRSQIEDNLPNPNVPARSMWPHVVGDGSPRD